MSKKISSDRQKGRYSPADRQRIRLTLVAILLMIVFIDWL